jgi:hypothetical protein
LLRGFVVKKEMGKLFVLSCRVNNIIDRKSRTVDPADSADMDSEKHYINYS